jgi:LAS superfamily LD-carboxypeptidase LdcB/uncharacterized membrane protein
MFVFRVIYLIFALFKIDFEVSYNMTKKYRNKYLVHLTMADLRLKLSRFVIAGLTRNRQLSKKIMRLRVKPAMTYYRVIRRYKMYPKYLVALLFIFLSCRPSTEKNDITQLLSTDTLFHSCIETAYVLTCEDIEKQIIKGASESWINEHVTKDFLLGIVIRRNNPLFVKVDELYTERNIFLIHPVYEAYKKMVEAALADSVKLILTSGHRTFAEQIYEWELRWDTPRTEIRFSNDVEKANYLLQYRSIPGTTRHHWGTDIDLNSFDLAYFQTKEGQKVYNWLSENAAKYGFYQPYTPYDEKRPTGYMEEKWHWSYKPLARLMLIKYLELVSMDDISGFKGDIAAKKLPVISDWVCGINPQIQEED